MDGIEAAFGALREVWRTWFPDPFARGIASTAVYLLVLYFAVMVVERLYRTRTDTYRTRHFAHDVAYYVYYRAGLHRLIFTAAILGALDRPLSFLDIGLLQPLPVALQIALGILIPDCAMYWLHRAQHRFHFLWAFHSTHHAPERLTFAAYLRFHPVEVLIGEILAFSILRVLGVDFSTWFAIYLIGNLIGEIQHSQIPWKLGPLYHVIVTPHFHAFHHSPDRRLHDANYGGLFAFWDHLFGTAVPAGTPAPERFGLDDVKNPTLLSTLTTPFALLRRYYVPRREPAPSAQALAPDPAERFEQ